MAGCTTPTSFAGHAHGGAQADHELTFNPDHPVGADHIERLVTEEAHGKRRRRRKAKVEADWEEGCDKG